MVMLVVGTALSGCAEPPVLASAPEPTGVGPPAAEPLVTDTTGSITGEVVDAALKALPGARVMTDPGIQILRTDAEGKFTFNGLEPGEYQVTVGKKGFDVDRRPVEVKAAQVSRVSVVMVSPGGVAPHHKTSLFRGEVECSFRVGVAGQGSSGPCGAPATGGNYYETIGVEAFWRSLITETTWTQSSLSSGPNLLLVLTHTQKGCSTVSPQNCVSYHKFSAVDGKSPLMQRCERNETTFHGCNGEHQYPTGEPNEIDADGMPVWFVAYTGKATGAVGAADVGVRIQQPFQTHITIFYGLPAPQGFSALKK